MYNIKSYFYRKFVFIVKLRNISVYDDKLLRLFYYYYFLFLFSRKYLHIFYIYHIWMNPGFIVHFDKKLIAFLLLKLQEDQEFYLNSIQTGTTMHTSVWLRNKKVKRNVMLSLNGKHFRKVRMQNNLLKELFGINHHFFSKLTFNQYMAYVYIYMRSFFCHRFGDLYFNANYSFFYFNYNNRRYEVINYYWIKKSFIKFILLLTNSLVFNTIPFFVFPKYLEDDVLTLYLYFLFIRTSVVYRLRDLKYLVNLNNLKQFREQFGVPSFFFLLDPHGSLLSLNILRRYLIPVGGFVTRNMNANSFDYPFFISSCTRGHIYFYYFIILQLVFVGLRKRKYYFWCFFVRYRIMYNLKKMMM